MMHHLIHCCIALLLSIMQSDSYQATRCCKGCQWYPYSPYYSCSTACRIRPFSSSGSEAPCVIQLQSLAACWSLHGNSCFRDIKRMHGHLLFFSNNLMRSYLHYRGTVFFRCNARVSPSTIQLKRTKIRQFFGATFFCVALPFCPCDTTAPTSPPHARSIGNIAPDEPKGNLRL